MTETTEYLHKFYNIILKDHINDPVIHSQWAYFVSMFRNSPIDKDRIELYLNILGSQHLKKKQCRSADTKTNSFHSSQNKTGMLDSTDKQIPAYDLKLDHKLSQKWRGNIDSFQKCAGQSLRLRKITSDQDANHSQRPPLESDSKPPKTRKQSYLYAFPLTTTTPNLNYTLPQFPSTHKQNKQQKVPQKSAQKYHKLCEISSRIVAIFNRNINLRA